MNKNKFYSLFIIDFYYKMPDLSQFEKTLGVKFKNQDLLLEALTHRSYINENSKWHLPNNERLEFLGDAVLELVVTEYLFNNFPKNSEGEMTSWRAALVNADMLSRIAKSIDLNENILLSKGEAKDVGKARDYILANAFEAVVGAMYLDQDYKNCKRFIEEKLVGYLPEIIEKRLYEDPKSKFQEEAQERVGITPTYEVLKEWGPDHAKHFIVGVFLGEDLVAQGEGLSKQAAQEEAARNGLEIKKW